MGWSRGNTRLVRDDLAVAECYRMLNINVSSSGALLTPEKDLLLWASNMPNVKRAIAASKKLE